MKKIIMLALLTLASTTLLPKNRCSFEKKCNSHFYSKIGTTLILGPAIGSLIGIINKRAESRNAQLSEKLILWFIFSIINGMTTKAVSCTLDSLDIPHSERGLGTTSWLASWIAYFMTENDYNIQL